MEVKENSSENGLRNSVPSSQVWLLNAAVALMYISYIWLPFFINKFNSDYHYTLWEILKPLDFILNYGNITGIRFCVLILFIVPWFNIVGGILHKKILMIVSIIQIIFLLFTVHNYFSDDAIKLSSGYYFYLIATIVAFVLGISGYIKTN